MKHKVSIVSLMSVFFYLSIENLNAQGINFINNDIRAAFNLAKSQNKMLFVEVYSKTCEHCMAMEPILKDKSVANFYNQHFVCYKLEITSTDAATFLAPRKIFVPSLPLFLFFDGNEVLQHFAMSNPNAGEVLAQAQKALDPTQRASNFRARFAAGERSDTFLFDLAMYCRVVCDTNFNIKIMKEYAAKTPTASYLEKNNWLVIQKLVMDVDNPMAKHLIDNYAVYNKKYPPKEVKMAAENLIMSSLYSSRGNKYDAPKIQQIRKQLEQIGIEKGSANARTLLPEVNYYFRNKKTAAATARANDYLTNAKAQIADYSYIIKLFNQRATDNSYVPTFKKWVSKALALAPANSPEAIELQQELTKANQKK